MKQSHENIADYTLTINHSFLQHVQLYELSSMDAVDVVKDVTYTRCSLDNHTLVILLDAHSYYRLEINEHVHHLVVKELLPDVFVLERMTSEECRLFDTIDYQNLSNEDYENCFVDLLPLLVGHREEGSQWTHQEYQSYKQDFLTLIADWTVSQWRTQFLYISKYI